MNIKERPILFKGEMVRAILSGQKTMTRRVVNPQPQDHHWDFFKGYSFDHRILETSKGLSVRFQHCLDGVGDEPLWVTCPMGGIGDVLWVRETWQNLLHAEGAFCLYGADYDDWDYANLQPWKPSIYMFKKDSRIKLKITNIRVERLQEITEEDAFSEGIDEEGEAFDLAQNILDNTGVIPGATHDIPALSPAKAEFKHLWNSTNGKPRKNGTDVSWEANPFVWVIEFEKL